jgi:hypothetical protein
MQVDVVEGEGTGRGEGVGDVDEIIQGRFPDVYTDLRTHLGVLVLDEYEPTLR